MICNGNSINRPESGYDPYILPLGWMSFLAGSTGLDIDLKDPSNTPSWLIHDNKLEGSKRVVGKVKSNLKKYWGSLEK